MIVSHRHGFIFCHVHKTAGEAITEALAPHLGWDDLVLGVTPLGEAMAGPYGERFGLHKHSPAARIREVVGDECWERSFTFAAVRHPVDRMVSLHRWLGDRRRSADRDRLRRGLPPWPRRRDRSPWNWPAMQAHRATSSFSAFIRHPDLARDPASRPQVATLGGPDGELLVDRVIRFEHLADDFADVVAHLGLPPTALSNRNASTSPTAVTAEDRAFLGERYADDFDRFGYT